MSHSDSHAGTSVERSDRANDAGPDGRGQATVTITVNNAPVSIHRGRQSVADIKRLGKVAAADELEQVIEHRLVPLPDNGSVTITGDEVFVSHPRDSASSHDALFAKESVARRMGV